MMKTPRPESLSRRERQIMDALFARGEGTVADVMQDLPDPPGYSAVRAMLRILEHKGHLTHRQDGARYVYVPVREREEAGRSAARHLLRTFFDGSPAEAAAALLDAADRPLTETEYETLRRLIEKAHKEGR